MPSRKKVPILQVNNDLVDILINNKAGKLLSTIPNNSGLHKPLEKIIS